MQIDCLCVTYNNLEELKTFYIVSIFYIVQYWILKLFLLTICGKNIFF